MSVNQVSIEKRPILKKIILLVFGVGLFGFIFSLGNLEIGYEVSKTIWLQWWVRILMLCLWGIVLFEPHLVKLNFFDKKINIYLGLLVGVVLLTILTGVNWKQSLWGNYYRGDGVVTWFHLLGLSFLSKWLLKRDEAFQLLPLIVSIAGLMLIVRIFFPDLLWTAVGFGNPNIEAGFLVVITPLIMFGLRKLHWGFKSISFLSILGTVVYLQSWGGVLALGLFLVINWWLQKPQLRKWVVFIPITFLALGLIGVMMWQPSNNSYFTESRSRLIHKLGRAARERPIWGWGWANVDAAFESVDWPLPMKDDIYVDKAHSELLEMLVVSGGVGVGVYLLFLGSVYLRVVNSLILKHEWGRTLFLVCLVYFFHSQTNVVSVAESAVFWMSLGLLFNE